MVKKGTTRKRAAKSSEELESNLAYSRRLFFGRQPLWGIGVTSSTAVTSSPDVISARSAVSRPRPTPLTRTRTERTPFSMAFSAAFSAASWPANGDFLRLPL